MPNPKKDKRRPRKGERRKKKRWEQHEMRWEQNEEGGRWIYIEGGRKGERWWRHGKNPRRYLLGKKKRFTCLLSDSTPRASVRWSVPYVWDINMEKTPSDYWDIFWALTNSASIHPPLRASVCCKNFLLFDVTHKLGHFWAATTKGRKYCRTQINFFFFHWFVHASPPSHSSLPSQGWYLPSLRPKICCLRP